MPNSIKPLCQTQVIASEDSKPNTSLTKVCLAEVCLAEICPAEACLAEVCPDEGCPAEVCPDELCLAEVTPDEPCPNEVYPAEVCHDEGRPAEVCPLEVWPYIGIVFPPLIPLFYTATEDFEMFGIRHSRKLLLLRLGAPILAQPG